MKSRKADSQWRSQFGGFLYEVFASIRITWAWPFRPEREGNERSSWWKWPLERKWIEFSKEALAKRRPQEGGRRGAVWKQILGWPAAPVQAAGRVAVFPDTVNSVHTHTHTPPNGMMNSWSYSFAISHYKTFIFLLTKATPRALWLLKTIALP